MGQQGQQDVDKQSPAAICIINALTTALQLPHEPTKAPPACPPPALFFPMQPNAQLTTAPMHSLPPSPAAAWYATMTHPTPHWLVALQRTHCSAPAHPPCLPPTFHASPAWLCHVVYMGQSQSVFTTRRFTCTCSTCPNDENSAPSAFSSTVGARLPTYSDRLTPACWVS